MANAIYDGTDAVMLSAETSVGKYPVEAVQFMARIAAETEKSIASAVIRTRRTGRSPANAEILADAAYRAAREGESGGDRGVHARGSSARSGFAVPSTGVHLRHHAARYDCAAALGELWRGPLSGAGRFQYR